MEMTLHNRQPDNRPQQPLKDNTGCLIFITAISLSIIIVAISIMLLIFSGISFLNMGKGDDASLPEEFTLREFTPAEGMSSALKIAIIPVKGAIGMGDDDTAETCRLLHQANTDEKIKAVIISINSPGGEVVACDNIYHAIKKIRENGKPVIAYLDSVAASGGYYIAAGCEQIIAHPLTTTGSLGVIIQTYKYYDLLNKIGLKSEPYLAGAMKDLLSGTRPTSPEEKALVQKLVEQVYARFIATVAAGRPGLTVEKIKNSNIGDGRIFLGEQALKLGLVDKLGYLEDAVKLAAEQAKLNNNYQAVSYQKKFSLKEFITGKTAVPELNVNLPGATGQSSLKLEPGKFYLLPPR